MRIVDGRVQTGQSPIAAQTKILGSGVISGSKFTVWFSGSASVVKAAAGVKAAQSGVSIIVDTTTISSYGVDVHILRGGITVFGSSLETQISGRTLTQFLVTSGNEVSGSEATVMAEVT